MDAMKKSRCVYVLLCFFKSALTARLPVQTGSICTSGKFKLEEWVWRRKKKFFLVLQRNTKLRGQINKSVKSVCFFLLQVGWLKWQKGMSPKSNRTSFSQRQISHTQLFDCRTSAMRSKFLPPHWEFHQNYSASNPGHQDVPVRQAWCTFYQQTLNSWCIVISQAARISLSWIRSETQSLWGRLSPSPCYQGSS